MKTISFKSEWNVARTIKKERCHLTVRKRFLTVCWGERRLFSIRTKQKAIMVWKISSHDDTETIGVKAKCTKDKDGNFITTTTK